MTKITTASKAQDANKDIASVSWRPAGMPILNALLQHVPSAADRPPWRPGLALDLHGQGGLVGKDRRHYTIVGHGEYANHVGGSRTLAANNQGIRTTKELRTSIGTEASADQGCSPGPRLAHRGG